MHCDHQQCLIAKWLGLSVIVRARARARARECIFPFFFFSVLKVTNIFCRLVVTVMFHGVRTTTVCDVTMMYCQERRMCPSEATFDQFEYRGAHLIKPDENSNRIS